MYALVGRDEMDLGTAGEKADNNPQVTLGLYLVGALTPIRAVLCFVSQMLAGMASAAVVSAIFPGPLSVSTTLGVNTSITQGVFLEMFLTALLIFTIFMLAAEKHKATFLAPVGIGLALFVAELVGVFYTGGSLNPTRSFGPCVVTRTFPHYHYIYWAGPLMGTLLAWGMYKIVKSVEYETVNPGQDFDDHEVCLLVTAPPTAEHTSLYMIANVYTSRLHSSTPQATPPTKSKSSALTLLFTLQNASCARQQESHILTLTDRTAGLITRTIESK
jgi:hypothetical protein